MYQQDWHSRLRAFTRASFYRSFNDQIQLCPYLDDVYSKLYRVALTRLVTSRHRLKIETRRPIIPRENRICGICGKLDDEYHFLLECSVLKDIRQKYIPAFYWKRPSVFKCVQLLRSSGRSLNDLAKICVCGILFKMLVAVLVIYCCCFFCLSFLLSVSIIFIWNVACRGLWPKVSQQTITYLLTYVLPQNLVKTRNREIRV